MANLSCRVILCYDVDDVSRIDATTLAGAARSLDGAALRLWCWMRATCDKQREYQATHAETGAMLGGVSQSTIARAIAELRAIGLVSIVRETKTATVYRVDDPEGVENPFGGVLATISTGATSDNTCYVKSDTSGKSDTSVKDDTSKMPVVSNLTQHPSIGTRTPAQARRPARLQNLPSPSQSASSDIPPPPVLRGSAEGGGGGGESSGGARADKAAALLAAIRDPRTRAEMAAHSDATLLAAIALAAQVKRVGDGTALAVRMVRDGSAQAEADRLREYNQRAAIKTAEQQEARQRQVAAQLDEYQREQEQKARDEALIDESKESRLRDALSAVLVSMPPTLDLTRRVRASLAEGIDVRQLRDVARSRFIRGEVCEFLRRARVAAVVVPVEQDVLSP